MKILLIEPDLILAETYQRALESAGHQVAACPGAQTGILVADQIKPEAAIIEIQLVEHSGIEFLYEFRSYADWQHIPVIINTHVPISEFAGSWQLFRQELGINNYLYKPETKLSRLISAVNELAVAA